MIIEANDQPSIDNDVADLEVRDAVLFMAKHIDFPQARSLFATYVEYRISGNPDALLFELAYALQSYAEVS